MRWGEAASPLGPLTLWADRLPGSGWALCGIHYEGKGPAREAAKREEELPLFRDVRRELEEYWAGERREFTVPWEVRGTPFREQVWAALAGVGYGETVSYGELAREIGRPRAARQVGQAVGASSALCWGVTGCWGRMAPSPDTGVAWSESAGY